MGSLEVEGRAPLQGLREEPPPVLCVGGDPEEGAGRGGQVSGRSQAVRMRRESIKHQHRGSW